MPIHFKQRTLASLKQLTNKSSHPIAEGKFTNDTDNSDLMRFHPLKERKKLFKMPLNFRYKPGVIRVR